jgi:hypothetical protein
LDCTGGCRTNCWNTCNAGCLNGCTDTSRHGTDAGSL